MAIPSQTNHQASGSNQQNYKTDNIEMVTKNDREAANRTEIKEDKIITAQPKSGPDHMAHSSDTRIESNIEKQFMCCNTCIRIENGETRENVNIKKELQKFIWLSIKLLLVCGLISIVVYFIFYCFEKTINVVVLNIFDHVNKTIPLMFAETNKTVKHALGHKLGFIPS